MGEMELNLTHKHTGSNRLWAAGILMDRGVWERSSFWSERTENGRVVLRINGREMLKNIHLRTSRNVQLGAFRAIRSQNETQSIRLSENN